MGVKGIHPDVNPSVHPFVYPSNVSVYPSVGMVSKPFWKKYLPNLLHTWDLPLWDEFLQPCSFSCFYLQCWHSGGQILAENGVSWVETCHLGQNRWPWNLTEDLENSRAPLCSHIKFYVSFHCHMGIQTGVTVRKRLNWVWPLRSWPSTSHLEQLHGYHFCYWLSLLKISRSYNDGNIVKRVWQTDRRTDG